MAILQWYVECQNNTLLSSQPRAILSNEVGRKRQKDESCGAESQVCPYPMLTIRGTL